MPTTSGRMFPAETRGMNLCCNSADVPPKKQSWRVMGAGWPLWLAPKGRPRPPDI